MPEPAAPKINGVVETCLYVDDLPRAVEFYREVLGLTPMVGNPERFQSFDAGRGRVLLLFIRGATLETMATSGGDIPPHNGEGPMHFALAIAAEDYATWRSRLQTRGVKIISETRWDRGGQSLYFHDPDGNLGELVTPGIWPNY
ncbi:MAG: VOC family protein [Cephaloticoccus sp.]|nr:VOC family protein [Cephaloticoccus sp.]MCF7760147.1 VOC family protein [Cephaloticoccus sp.]